MYEIFIYGATMSKDAEAIKAAVGSSFVEFGGEKNHGLTVFVDGFYGKSVDALNAAGYETDEDESE